MGTTYLRLVNNVLTRLNETEIKEADFSNNLRGVHASVKIAVKNSINKIQNKLFQLNTNAGEHRQKLVPGVSEYSWPSGFKSVDWNSFYIVRNSLYNVSSTILRKINREQWYSLQKNTDDNYPLVGRGPPNMVFESHGQGFGVSPVPDQEYEVCYRYYFTSKKLSLPNDECNIPSDYDYVIEDGAMYFMKLFKDDMEQADRAEKTFNSGISDIRNALYNRSDTLTDTRVYRG